jgi:hypothetical protein
VPAAEADLVREPGQVATEILLHDLAVVLASYGTQIHLEGLLRGRISVPAGPGNWIVRDDQISHYAWQ